MLALPYLLRFRSQVQGVTFEKWLPQAGDWLLLWSGIFVPALHEPVVAHAITMSVGGSLVALAHLANMRLSRGHTH